MSKRERDSDEPTAMLVVTYGINPSEYKAVTVVVLMTESTGSSWEAFTNAVKETSEENGKMFNTLYERVRKDRKDCDNSDWEKRGLDIMELSIGGYDDECCFTYQFKNIAKIPKKTHSEPIEKPKPVRRMQLATMASKPVEKEESESTKILATVAENSDQ